MSDPGLPAGTVTFLFSDIEGSTRLWETRPAAMASALERHDALVRKAIEVNGGQVIKTTGDGFHAVFDRATDAACAALAIQHALQQEPWQDLQPERIRARLGLHTGEAGARSSDYYGTTVNRAARLMAVGHGGQILLSTTTADLLRDQLPPSTSLLDLGEHRLKDLVRPERIYQLNHSDLPAEFPALNSIDAFPNNLPVQLTSYIGREQEMQEVRRLLGSTRLLTLIGPGGIGKTRLALQVAAEVLSGSGSAANLPNGVWLVELAPLAQPAQVLEQIASIFQLHESRDNALDDIVTNFLRAKRMLLILDNCEHVVEACARLADHLLRTCPGLKMIASSREALGIAGETLYRVPPLSMPRPDHYSPAELMSYEAVQLFAERAAAARPGFAVNERNAAAVARICQRLDGIPLAIELAAARVTAFTPEQIAARLDDRFRLLTGGSRTSLPRQQTLRALIDWSYELLSPPEQTLFRRLSVFTGGWSLEAAEQICSGLAGKGSAAVGSETDIFPEDVLDLLSHLINKSLVLVNEQGEQARYSLLETIRQYASEQIHAVDRISGTDEIRQLRDRHLAYFAGLMQNANEQFISQGMRWLNQVDAENENIRSAFDWGLETDPEAALNLIGDLFIYFNIRLYPLEAQQLVRDAIARVETLPPQRWAAGDKHTLALTKGYLALGQFYMTLGQMSLAKTALTRGLELARSMNNQDQMMWALGLLTATAFYLSEVEPLRSHAQELISNMTRPNEGWARALGLSMLSWAEGMLGHTEERERLIREARALVRPPEHPLSYNTMLMMGVEARTRGDLVTARDYLERCLSFTRMIHSLPNEAMVRSELAHIERQTGNLAAAKEAYRTTIHMWSDLGHRGAIAHQLECFAFLAITDEQPERAVTLLSAAQAVREAINAQRTSYEQPEYQQAADRLRELLTPDAFDQHWQHGQELELEQAVAYALETQPG